MTSAFRAKLELLVYGYVRYHLKSKIIPQDIIELSIVWLFIESEIHTDIIKGGGLFNHNYQIEMYMDKFVCSVMKFDHFEFRYIDPKQNVSVSNVGWIKINAMYENCMAFILRTPPQIESTIYSPKYQVIGKDVDNNIIGSAQWPECRNSFYIPQSPPKCIDSARSYFESKIAVTNKVYVEMDEWLNVLLTNKDYKNISMQNIFQYKRLFYYIQFRTKYDKNRSERLIMITFDDFIKYIMRENFESSCYRALKQELLSPIDNVSKSAPKYWPPGKITHKHSLPRMPYHMRPIYANDMDSDHARGVHPLPSLPSKSGPKPHLRQKLKCNKKPIPKQPQ